MKKSTLNEIYCLFYSWIEKDIKFDVLKTFDLFLKKDRSYLSYVPNSNELRMQLYKLETIFCSLNEDEYSQFEVFIYHCCNLYNYDYIVDKKLNLNTEKLYCKSALAQYYIINFLNDTLVIEKFNAFKNELNQATALIINYYSNNKEKKAIKDMLKSKIDNLYSRYKLEYELPICLQ